MSVASPANRAELKEYIKMKLGAPVLQINVSDEQMDLAINDAFQYFYERQHFDAMEKVYLSVQVTQELCDFFMTGEIESVAQPSGTPSDVKTQNNFIVLPDSVVGVNQILTGGGLSGAGLGLAGGVVPYGAMVVGNLFGMGTVGGLGFDISSYYSMQGYLSTLRWTLFNPPAYSFNKRSHRLFINSENFNNVAVGSYIVLECDVKVDADLYDDIWDDMFLKRLSTAYVQLAWGRNLTKFNNVALPGGITMNGDQIYNEAKEEIALIAERFAMDYADPVLDIVG